jgi:hypothetical protein
MFASLNQGKQFKQRNDKNKNKDKDKDKDKDKNKNKQSSKLTEGFTATSDPEHRYNRIPVFMNQYKQMNQNKAVNENDFQQLTNLQNEFNALGKQLDNAQQSVKQEGATYIERVSKSNPYLSKNITTDPSAGQLTFVSSSVGGYVTDRGMFKNYPDQATFDATAGKNGCPVGVISGVKSDQYSSLLKNGTDMKSGQSCGAEGKNVYASHILSNPSVSYNSCSYNTNPTDNTTTPAMTLASELYTFDECKQYAIDNGNRYFAMQGNPDDNYKSTCLVSNDLTVAQQYGDASRLVTKIKLWSTEGLTDINGQPKASGQTSVRLNNKGQLVFSNAANEEQTFSLGSGLSGCEQEFAISEDSNCSRSDLKHYTNTNLETCKQRAFSIPGAVGFVMNDNGKECWIKNRIKNVRDESGRTIYTIVREESKSKCKFFMVLQTDGNLCIYKGLSPSNNEGSGALWCSMTNGKQLDFNWDFVASVGGKYGKSFFSTGQSLAINEFIGSDDGKLQLIMEPSGNLVLYTSTVGNGCPQNKEIRYGANNNTNAIYQINEIGVPSNLGKLAFIDNDGIAHPYSTTSGMISSYSNDYIRYDNFDSSNDLQTADSNMESSGSSSTNNNSPDDCMTACNNTEGCAGFVWAQNDSGNKCRLKNSNMFPNSQRIQSNGDTMYVRKPQINNGDMCSKEIVDIDTLQYENYVKGSDMTTDMSVCKDTVISDATRTQIEELKSKMAMKAQEISAKIKELYERDRDIFNKMNVNDVELKKNISTYMRTVMGNKKEKITAADLNNGNKEGMQNLDMNDVNGMLADTDLRILQENYSYILWSVLAVGLLTITINVMKVNKK